MFDFTKVNTNTQGNTAVVAPKQEKIVERKTEEDVAITTLEIEKTNIGLNQDYLSMKDTEINSIVAETVKKINLIEEEMNVSYVERENEVHMLALSFVAGVNAFFHGPAGTGKSALVEDFSQRFKASNYFRILMGKTTEPGEVFGPVSINAMKNDSYKVNTHGKLPEANISFIDEIFKCNSAVLNSLLTIMNEKVFFNDGIQSVPLISIVGASNEYYEDDSLVALYDRFLLRWHVDYIQDASNRMNLFKNFLNNRKNSSAFQSAALTTIDTKTEITVKDLMLLNEKVKEVKISAKILNDYNKLFISLEKKGITVSDRRKNESLKVLQASAILDGKNEVDSSDFEALKFTLWNSQEQIQIIQEEIIKIANPNMTKLNQYRKVLDDYKAELESIEANSDSEDYAFNKSITITETIKNLQYAINTVTGIIPTLKEGSKDQIKFMGLLNEMEEYIKEITQGIFS